MLSRSEIEDPTAGQTEKTIGQYLAQCNIGSEIAIRDTHTGRLHFKLTMVSWVHPKNGRLTTAGTSYAGNSWWRRTGRSTWFPKGQAHLVEATPEIRKFV